MNNIQIIETIESFIDNKEKILESKDIIYIGNKIYETNIRNLPLIPKYYSESINCNHERIYFISFASEKFKRGQYRIFSQALEIPVYSNIIAFNENSLINNKDFWREHGDFILNNKRGYGYWLWKPFIILEMLKYINDNEIIVYADTGCVLNKKANSRLNEYIDIVKDTHCGMLAFRLSNHFTESMFTKMDVINLLDAHDLLDTVQVAATVIILRKCEDSINFVKKWYELSSMHKLIDDTQSIISNTNKFIEHRHDQSFFSILSKQRNIAIIYPDETDVPNDNFPIWGLRNPED